MSNLGPQFQRVFHASEIPPDVFMKAPTIHVGPLSAAEKRRSLNPGWFPLENPRSPVNIYELAPSQHIETHDEVLSDSVANAADMHFLRKNRYPVPTSIKHSVGRHMSYQDMRSAVRGYRALKQNKALVYDNIIEGGTGIVIPAPHHNISIVGEAEEGVEFSDRPSPPDPHTQAPLPMDYTVLQQSDVTKEHREDPRSADKKWSA